MSEIKPPSDGSDGTDPPDKNPRHSSDNPVPGSEAAATLPNRRASRTGSWRGTTLDRTAEAANQIPPADTTTEDAMVEGTTTESHNPDNRMHTAPAGDGSPRSAAEGPGASADNNHPPGNSPDTAPAQPGVPPARAATRPDATPAQQPGARPEHGHPEATPPARPDQTAATWTPLGQDGAAARNLGQDHIRSLAAEVFRDHTGDREYGVNVVGDKPTKPPGDTSDLPPSGEELLEMENDTNPSRLDRFRDKVYKDVGEVIDGTKIRRNRSRTCCSGRLRPDMPRLPLTLNLRSGQRSNMHPSGLQPLRN